ncbi:formate--tetrahydrofolate ligase [Fulvitalea axinellae]|uniref:Formate--tetrahydrofolate ligase n=1 Tax=Fulvitalea axinellae TaxID=1182444 RepID=A0AAU9CJ42_9BACT|nr:formate--tetrahydrofolate ligase [Fulvitalea axinellae]
MKTDIEIAREAHLEPIGKIAEGLGVAEEALFPYGRHMAKLSPEALPANDNKGNLILVTAITPTKSGNGKTLVSVGLSMGLNKIGKKSAVALREPSLGPCFGMKGGAAGGGYAQVVPMENINLHFTGDFHAITSAHNMISAMLDNYVHQHRNTEKQLREVVWRRVLDVNDRNLRHVMTGMGGNANGVISESGFDITPASEIMAILCLAKDLDDLRARVDRIILGYDFETKPFTVKDLGISGAICVLLKDALDPNLVQTTENTPAIVHGGPFANIAHGCNSVRATRLALDLSDYVITEAGFGADLGAEKFFNIKCRAAGLNPKATVLVVTAQALKYHGGASHDDIKLPNKEALTAGFANLDRHIENMKAFGQNVVVAVNKFHFDTDEELDLVKEHCASQDVPCALMEAFVKGGEGAVELAKAVADTVDKAGERDLEFTYEEGDDLKVKLEKIASKVYGADGVALTGNAPKMLRRIKKLGLDHLPVCVAKTQYSFSDNPKAIGDMSGFTITFDDLIINAGAGFIVAKSGSIMRMPGLPKSPQALRIDIVDGEVEGLS